VLLSSKESLEAEHIKNLKVLRQHHIAKPKMSIVKYGGYIFIFYTVLILYRFSMYPAVLMAISDFEINFLCGNYFIFTL